MFLTIICHSLTVSDFVDATLKPIFSLPNVACFRLDSVIIENKTTGTINVREIKFIPNSLNMGTPSNITKYKNMLIPKSTAM